MSRNRSTLQKVSSRACLETDPLYKNQRNVKNRKTWVQLTNDSQSAHSAAVVMARIPEEQPKKCEFSLQNADYRHMKTSLMAVPILSLNLYAPCILYIYRTDVPLTSHSTLFIYLVNKYIIFLDFISPSSFMPPQNVVYFLMLPFLIHKIHFTSMVC